MCLVRILFETRTIPPLFRDGVIPYGCLVNGSDRSNFFCLIEGMIRDMLDGAARCRLIPSKLDLPISLTVYSFSFLFSPAWSRRAPSQSAEATPTILLDLPKAVRLFCSTLPKLSGSMSSSALLCFHFYSDRIELGTQRPAGHPRGCPEPRARLPLPAHSTASSSPDFRPGVRLNTTCLRVCSNSRTTEERWRRELR